MIRRLAWAVVIFLVLTGMAPSGEAPDPLRHPDTLPGLLPRPAGADTGSVFAERTRLMTGRDRQSAAVAELKSGNVPDFLRRLYPVSIVHTSRGSEELRITFWCTPDYMSIGSDEDYLRIPLTYVRAVEVARFFHCVLPTRKLVDEIYRQAACILQPEPLPAGPAMRSSEYYLRHQRMIEAQRSRSGCVPGDLTAGHKKDLVLTNRLFKKMGREAIYGWHTGDNAPIQPLSTVHGERYADYSHGIRLVYERITVNGKSWTMYEAMKNPGVAPALTYEGLIANFRELLRR